MREFEAAAAIAAPPDPVSEVSPIPHQRSAARESPTLLGTGIPFKSRCEAQIPEYMQSLQAVAEKTAGLRRAGAAALDLAYVAAGRLDAYWEMALAPWDIAAGALLVREAGGLISDFNGGNDRLVLTDAVHFGGKLQDFGPGDRLDLRQFNPSTTTLAYSEKADNSGGTLTVTDGTLTAKIALLGQYAAPGFHKAPDGVGGTYVTYTPSAASFLAAPHS